MSTETIPQPAAEVVASDLPPSPHRRELDLVEVATWPRERLELAMRQAPAPDPDAIAPWEWNGYNVPFFTRILGFRKFKKGFRHVGDVLQGYNVKVIQDGGPLDPWLAQRDRDGRPIHHGFYDVVLPAAPDDHYPDSLLINYDCGRNPAWDPSARLRDYLVALGPDTLLGKAYVALGAFRVPVSYFILQRADRV